MMKKRLFVRARLSLLLLQSRSIIQHCSRRLELQIGLKTGFIKFSRGSASAAAALDSLPPLLC
jgi:hypothetical protein